MNKKHSIAFRMTDDDRKNLELVISDFQTTPSEALRKLLKEKAEKVALAQGNIEQIQKTISILSPKERQTLQMLANALHRDLYTQIAVIIRQDLESRSLADSSLEVF